MTIDQKHLRLVAIGGYTSGTLAAETWQCGVNLWADVSVPTDTGDLPTTGDYSADSAALATGGLHYTSNWKWFVGLGSVVDPIDYLENQARPAWNALMATTAISSGVVLKQLRLYPMQGNGKAFEERVAVASYDTPLAGGRTGTLMPLETSIVASWRTLRPGPRGRGRIYLPPSTATAVATDGFISSTLTASLPGDLASFLAALSVDPVSPTATHVRPIVTGSPWDKYAVITTVDVGNIWDAQRRRRRSLAETRTSATVTY